MLADVCRRQAGGDTDLSDPFWAQLWESTAGLDRYLGERDLSGVRVLELGCGTGLAGIAALLRGADVTFTDGVSDPLLLVRISLAALPAAGLSSRYRVRRLRFGVDVLNQPPFALILGSDISYLKPYWPQLLQTIQTHLGEGGEVLLSDPYRSISTEFRDWLGARRWQVQEHKQATAGQAIRILRCKRQ